MSNDKKPTAGDDTVIEQPKQKEPRIEMLRQGPTLDDLRKLEETRQQKILEHCRANKIDESHAQRWIESGADLNEVADGILTIIGQRNKARPESVGYLDMDKSETRRYSLVRALRAAVNQNWKDAGLELEANQSICQRLNRVPRSDKSFFVPLDVMMRDLVPGGVAKRDMTVAGVSGSNYLVGTENYPGSFIDLLRNSSVGLRMGVQRLSGLKGNVTIPKMTAGNTAYWLADETTQITESQPTIGQLALAPKNVAALTELSHQLLQQSTPDAENLVLQSIARDIGLAVDVGILRGSGASGQPTGIATTGSIGAFTGTSLASTGVLNAIADVGTANALQPGCGFVTTPAVAALLMDPGADDDRHVATLEGKSDDGQHFRLSGNGIRPNVGGDDAVRLVAVGHPGGVGRARADGQPVQRLHARPDGGPRLVYLRRRRALCGRLVLRVVDHLIAA